MKTKKLIIMAAICAATCVAPFAVNAQTTPAREAITEEADDDDTDFGWIGLLGLAGLAGLLGKKRDNYRDDRTATGRSDR